MSELANVFGYQNKTIRTISTFMEVWFVLKDVCEVLGIRNNRNVFNRLDEDEKGVREIDTLGGRQEMQVVNESGLYAVILRSNSSQAKPFRRWVTHEVLPSIRKTGYYSQMTDKDLYEQLGKRLNGQQELIIREYVPTEPRSSVVSAIPLSWVHEKTVVKR